MKIPPILSDFASLYHQSSDSPPWFFSAESEPFFPKKRVSTIYQNHSWVLWAELVS